MFNLSASDASRCGAAARLVDHDLDSRCRGCVLVVLVGGSGFRWCWSTIIATMSTTGDARHSH